VSISGAEVIYKCAYGVDDFVSFAHRDTFWHAFVSIWRCSVHLGRLSDLRCDDFV
jgi:hypothetical protein